MSEFGFKLVTLESQDIANDYENGFVDLWEAERIAGTENDGAAMDLSIASQISTAKNEIMLASMVISSGAVLGALFDAIERSFKVCGVYEGPKMNQVIKDWEKKYKWHWPSQNCAMECHKE
jgi:hypothetical protein